MPAFDSCTLPRLDHAGRYHAEGRCFPHAHRGHELLTIRSGRCALELEGVGSVEAGPGTVLLIPPRVAHHHRDRGAVATSFAVFTVPARRLAPRLRRFEVGVDDPLPRLLDVLVDCHYAGADASVAGGILLALVARVEALDPDPAARRRPPALARAESYLAAHLAEPLDQDALAAAAGVTAGHLRALFRAHHGRTAASWHLGRRLELAQRLLRDPRLRIGEVAEACGWSDPSHFCRVFRSAIGASPGRWRLDGRAG